MSGLVAFDSDSQPRHPWYKERLCKRYLKDSNPKINFSGALSSRRWTFLPKGVDDFRDGYPLSSNATFIPSNKGPSPVLKNVTDETERKPIKRFTREQACFSKLLPLQQARREYIEEIEYGLTQHPLALYPHLEEGVPPELFEEIVDVLDPEMRLRSASGSYIAVNEEEEEEELDTPQKELSDIKSVKSRDASTRQSALSEESKHKNPYTWLSKKEESAREANKSKKKSNSTPVVDENVKQVTKEFCGWVASLGGEQYSIQEETIFSLFNSGHDTKPTLSVPIHVVELNNVPAELRMLVGASPQQTSWSSYHVMDHKTQSKASEPAYCPSWVKTTYGAWYLDPKTWMKRRSNEQLKDPKFNENDNGKDSNRLNTKDEELLHLHGTIAFKEFIEKNRCRKPEFLSKLFAKNDTCDTEKEVARESRTFSPSTWIRSNSASTHEDSIIN
ncbi:protein FAM47E [Bombina bombina]|uniref:protein FAM47E n=1 Tax=Bombina bombina TaxID=8345 RepID=UPI00235AAA12|nr:protein FAM47E [Bombina bombina]